jgi:glutamyl-Q tRNA(Asp) synthetase
VDLKGISASQVNQTTMHFPAQPKPYIGRFAPSPTGPLHAGSLVAALASWLDARAHGGRWLLRLEDIDTQRCKTAYADLICAQLRALGLEWDGAVVRQTDRLAAYEAALQDLQAGGHVYACACSRAMIAATHPPLGASGEMVYPGTCAGASGLAGRDVQALRLRVGGTQIDFEDRFCGAQSQELATQCGDYVIKRADGPFAYHLACVVDDGAAGVTHVVRGQDLLTLTARHIHLQTLLGLPAPQYLHVPLVKNSAGEKLSKQTGAAAIDTQRPADTLRGAAVNLGLQLHEAASSVTQVLDVALALWVQRYKSGA